MHVSSFNWHNVPPAGTSERSLVHRCDNTGETNQDLLVSMIQYSYFCMSVVLGLIGSGKLGGTGGEVVFFRFWLYSIVNVSVGGAVGGDQCDEYIGGKVGSDRGLNIIVLWWRMEKGFCLKHCSAKDLNLKLH